MAFAKVLYPASVLDLDTIGCLRALQEMRLQPKNTAKPLRSFGKPAQLASRNALIKVDDDLCICNLTLDVYLKYLNIRFTDV